MNKLNTLKKKLDFLLEDELSSKEKCEEILHISQEIDKYILDDLKIQIVNEKCLKE